MKHFLLLFHFIGLFALGTCMAQIADAPTPRSKSQPTLAPLGKKLQVGLFINQPFANENNEGYDGFCVDLWKEMAADLGQSFEFIPYTNVTDLLNATAQNKVDLAIGNIFITHEREKIVEFTQPYLQGGLQIMIDEKRESSWRRLWDGLRDSGHLCHTTRHCFPYTGRTAMESGVSP